MAQIVIDTTIEKKGLNELERSLKEQEKQAAKVNTELEKTQAKLTEVEAEYSRLAEGARSIAKEMGLSDEKTDELIASQVKGANSKVAASYDNLNEKVGELESKQQEWNSSIQDTKAQIDSLKNAEDNAGFAGQTAGETTSEGFHNVGASAASATQNTKKAADAMDKFTHRVKNLLKRVLVFSIIARALNQLRQYLGKVLGANKEFQQSLNNLKGALLTAFQPIWEKIVPWLVAFINVLAAAAKRLAEFTAKIFGTNTAETSKNAKALNKEAKAIDAVGASAKKSGKSLAGFDTINQLNGNKSAGGSGNFDMTSFGNDLGKLEAIVSGCLLALGTILLFSGHVPLGIALIATGSLGLASLSDETKTDIMSMITEQLGSIVGLLIGSALVALGVILVLAGQLAPGIAMIVAGAASLVSFVALNWDSIVKFLKSPLGGIVELCVGSALLAIGLILALSSPAHMALGIALIAAGAVSLVAAVALNWNSIVGFIKSPLGAIVGLCVGVTLLAIGLILTLSGSNMFLGIALIAAGAASIITVIALNWDSICGYLKTSMGAIVGLCVGTALLAIGLILALTGVALPLGIALIIAGAGTMFTVVALNWDAIKDKFQEVWKGIKEWFNTNVAPKFTKEYWAEKFSSISEGLKQKIKDGINAAIEHINRFIGWLNEKLNFSWKGFSILGKEVFPAGHLQLVNIPKIPLLAQGAVIPPNRQFLAMLGDQKQGTNIETPLETMVEAFKAAGGGAQTINIKFTGSLAELARILKPEIERESSRVGGIATAR